MQREKGYSIAITSTDKAIAALATTSAGTYTLGELVNLFEPVSGKEAPSFLLNYIPTGLELKAMGQTTKGEIGIIPIPGKKLRVVYGTKRSVLAPRCLIHNHPLGPLLPSQGDAQTSYSEDLRVEFVSNNDGTAQIRYHFGQRRDHITIEYLATGIQIEKRAPETDDPFRHKAYREAIKISGLPIDLTTEDEDNGEDDEENDTDAEDDGLIKGVYDVTIIPWEIFLEKYDPQIFFRLFRRKSNWTKHFSRDGIDNPSQIQKPHPSPQPRI